MRLFLRNWIGKCRKKMMLRERSWWWRRRQWIEEEDDDNDGVRSKKRDMVMVLRFVFNLGVRRMQKDLIEREIKFWCEILKPSNYLFFLTFWFNYREKNH